jgi:hypothetical protein
MTTQYPHTLADLEDVLKRAMARTYPVSISYWEEPRDADDKIIKGAPLEAILRTIEPYEINTNKRDGSRYVRAMTRITGEGKPGPRAYRLDRFGTWEQGHLPGCITVHRSEYLVPRTHTINMVLAHAMEHYNKGWDVVIEAYTPEDIWRVIRHTITDDDALDRMRQIVDISTDRRASDAQLWAF